MTSSETLNPLRRGRTNRFRERALGTAITAAASAAFADSAAATTIIVSPGSTATGETISFLGDTSGDIQVASGMMGDDLSLRAPAGGMGDPDSTVEFSVLIGTGMGAVDYLRFLNVGDTVDASLFALGSANKGFLQKDAVPNAPWLPGNTGHAGFQFDDGFGTTLYGWVELDFTTTTDFVVLQWAYDADGDAIDIPEPSTALLIGLGLAGLAIAGRKWRRRPTPSQKT